MHTFSLSLPKKSLTRLPGIRNFFYMHATYSCTADPKKRTLRTHQFFYWDPIIVSFTISQTSWRALHRGVIRSQSRRITHENPDRVIQQTPHATNGRGKKSARRVAIVAGVNCTLNICTYSESPVYQLSQNVWVRMLYVSPAPSF